MTLSTVQAIYASLYHCLFRYLPIHKAAMEGHLPIVKELVAGGSPVRPQNNEGCAPLHYAARGGHLAIVQYLLAARVSDSYQAALLGRAESVGAAGAVIAASLSPSVLTL